jgi:ABC-type ATPase with predicted acetyltransferase domain
MSKDWECKHCGFINRGFTDPYCDGCGRNIHKEDEQIRELKETKKESSYWGNTGRYKKGKKR